MVYFFFFICICEFLFVILRVLRFIEGIIILLLNELDVIEGIDFLMGSYGEDNF